MEHRTQDKSAMVWTVYSLSRIQMSERMIHREQKHIVDTGMTDIVHDSGDQ